MEPDLDLKMFGKFEKGRVHIYRNELPPACIIKIIIALTLKLLRNMCTEMLIMLPKITKKIIDLGAYKGSGVGYDWGAAYIKQFLSII